MKIFGCFILIIFSMNLWAQEIKYLIRSPKGLLTGDAYTTIGDDEYALFYNPASLGKNKGVQVTPFQGSLMGPNILAYEDKIKNLPKKDPMALSDKLMGIPLYAGAGTVPGLKMGNFGMNAIFNQQASMVLRNRIHPTLDIDYRSDKGFIAGYAFTAGSLKKAKKQNKKAKAESANGHIFSFGVGYKFIQREALVGNFPVTGADLSNVLLNNNEFDYKILRDQLGYSKGKGHGVDLGLHETIYKGNTETSMGFSVLDMGNTKMDVYSGSGYVPGLDMMMNYGASFKQDFGWWFDYRFSFDIHPINAPIDFERKLHVGFEAGPKILKLLSGWNAGYASYGAQLDLWLFRVVGGFYGIETGAKYQDEQSKRFVIYLSLLDFSFDV